MNADPFHAGSFGRLIERTPQRSLLKVKSIELIDSLVLGTLLDGLSKYDYKIMILPDHPTPLSLRTHTSDPVPYVIYRKGDKGKTTVMGYDEFQASDTGIFISEGHTLMPRFLAQE
ncbi:MAG: hypothetical protein WBJ73_00730 [Caldicoprobacterales bacterium]